MDAVAQWLLLGNNNSIAGESGRMRCLLQVLVYSLVGDDTVKRQSF